MPLHNSESVLRYLAMNGEVKITQLEELLRRASERRSRAAKELEAATRDETALRRVLEMVGVKSRDIQENEVESDEPTEVSPAGQYDETSPPRLIVRPSTNGRAKKIRITQAVRNLLPEIEGEFQPPDVTMWLQRKFPHADIRPPSVSAAIWRLADKGEGIRKVREGSGSEPNTYEKIPQDVSTQDALADEENTPEEEDNANKEELMRG